MSETMQGAEVIRIGIRALEQRLGVERTTIWRWYRAGRFPVPHYLGERRVWILAEVDAWERERLSDPASARRASRHAERLGRNQGTGEPPPSKTGRAD